MLADTYGSTLLPQAESEWLPVRELAVAAMMTMIRADLDLLGVGHDNSFLSGR